MLNFPKWKIFLVLTISFLSIYFCVPNLISPARLEKLTFLPQTRVNLGLDLRGGSYLLLEVNFNTYLKDQLENLRNDIREVLRENKVDGKRIGYTGGLKIVDDKISIELTDVTVMSGVEKIIQHITNDITIDNVNNVLQVSYRDIALKDMKRKLIEQSVEIVRRRVDETGTREPDIQRQGDNRILLQVPGLDNPENLKRLLGKTAKLTFHLLDETMPYPDLTTKPVPPGTERLESVDRSSGGQPVKYDIKKTVIISGDMLANATTGFSSRDNEPVVNIRFNNVGAKKFADVTKNNVGKPFAIVLDNKVLTAPVINEAILGGSAQISGRFTSQDANDLALLLRAGALPAPLDIVEERSVGPSLGSDSVQAGRKAVTLAFVFVVIFMLSHYGIFGLFADLSLFMNIITIFAVMSLFGATLTLPGIAGIVLTIGMAVDANVLIFERIREEIRLGRSAFSSVDAGFKLAFGTIFDSNFTALTAAFVLYLFGAGPIKGFAVTLALGILASMFNAVLLSRLMISTWMKRVRPKTLHL